MKASDSRSEQPASERGSRAPWLCALLLAGIIVAANLAGVGSGGAHMWGAHAYRYLPVAALPVAMALLALAVLGLLVLKRLPRSVAELMRRLDDPRVAPLLRVALAVMAVAAPALFWRFREGHVLLGDGSPLVTDLPRGLVFHPHEPLTVYLHHVLYSVLPGALFAGVHAPEEIARDVVAFSSCVLGGVFVLLAGMLAGELVRATDGDAASGSVPAHAGRGLTALLIGALLVSQGAMQVFFGYVENYGYVTCAIAAFLVALLRAARAPAALPVAAALLALAIAFDLSAIVLLPALLLAMVMSWRQRGGMLAALGALLALPAVLALCQWILHRGGSPFRFTDSLQEIVQTALHGHGEAGRLQALVAPGHLWDTLNEQLLLGPLAGVGLVLGVLLAIAARRSLRAGAWWLVAAAACVLGGILVTGDLNLGYARDWDLFVPFGVVLTAATLVLWQAAGARHRVLALLLAVSLFQTIAWVALNASFERSFERMKHLPLGFGRAQVVVASWYLRHDQPEQARQWFRAALTEYPANAPAHYALGQLAFEQADLRGARSEFAAAVASRPDKREYRLALADALVLDSDLAAGIAQLQELIRREPARPEYWGACAIALEGAHDHAHSQAAIERAIALAPGDTLYAGLRGALAGADGYARGMLGYWNHLVRP